MAGGNWTAQNKVLPGVYTNYVGQGNSPAIGGATGIVGIPLTFPWLEEGKALLLDSAAAIRLCADFGASALPVREAMKNASKVYLYRLNHGTKAQAAVGGLKCEAVFSGGYGNRLSVSVENAIGNTGKFHVVTWLDTLELERQLAADIGGLKNNAWIRFTKVAESGQLAVSAGVTLAGGTDGTVSNSDYAAFLSEMELITVNAVACPSSDTQVKELFIVWARRMIKEEGKYLQAAIADTSSADFEAVISVKNGVLLEDGTQIPKELATAYIAGATAACPLTHSLTNSHYKGAVDVDSRYTTTQQEDFARAGQLVFVPSPMPGDGVVIQKDINTLVTFTESRTYALSKNKIIRALFAIAGHLRTVGQLKYSGKIANSEQGRMMYKTEILAYFRSLESQGVIREVTPEDIVTAQGELIDAMSVTYAVRPVDVIETIYNTITVLG